MTGRRNFPRIARVNEVVREVLAEELEGMSDPRLEFVTVTGVEVSADLKHATVYYSTLDDGLDESGDDAGGSPGDGSGEQEGRAGVEKALAAARKHLQAALGRQVRLKYVPRLEFVADPGVAQGRRIDDILRHLHDEPGAG